MPLDSAGYPQAPTDIGALGRRVVQLERAIQLGGGARSLVQASVGRGGIRVTKGGSVTIEAGGAVVIEKGDLVLGEGKIEGAALTHQLEANAYTDTSSNISVGTSWTSRASVTVNRPSWATSTIVQAFALAHLESTGGSDGDDLGLDLRAVVDGQAGLEMSLPVGYRNTIVHASGGATHARETTASSITVQAQLRARSSGVYKARSGNRADLRVVAQFMR